MRQTTDRRHIAPKEGST